MEFGGLLAACGWMLAAATADGGVGGVGVVAGTGPGDNNARHPPLRHLAILRSLCPVLHSGQNRVSGALGIAGACGASFLGGSAVSLIGATAFPLVTVSFNILSSFLKDTISLSCLVFWYVLLAQLLE